MRWFLCIILILFGLTSCVSYDAISLADGVIYVGLDAYISYDIYYGMYNEGVIDNAPILMRVNGEVGIEK
jgi:hypothetical protein